MTLNRALLPYGLSLLTIALLGGCISSPQPMRVDAQEPFFQRYSAPDAESLQRDIDAARSKLAAARSLSAEPMILELSAELGGLLTTARKEHEAIEILQSALDRIGSANGSAIHGWLLLNSATANQYLRNSELAAAQFPEALRVARSLADRELEHYTLHHWGRFLVEKGEIQQARHCFVQALAIREALGDPRQESSRRALATLDELR